MMTVLFRLIRGLNIVIMAISGLVLLSMMLIVTSDVLFTTFLGKPIQNVIEIVAFYMMVGIVFLPLGSAELRDDHIKTDILTQKLPRKLWLVSQVLVGVISILILSLLTYVSFGKAIEATRRGEVMMGTTLIQIWPSRWILLLGFGFFIICVLYMTLRLLSKWKPPLSEEEGK
ncbi:TRAP transporter small permease [Roseovarius sp.]